MGLDGALVRRAEGAPAPDTLEHMSKSSDTTVLQTVIDSVVAFGTLGALLAAVTTIIIAKNRELLGEVAGVRGWMSWRPAANDYEMNDGPSDRDVVSSFPPGTDFNAVINVHNGSDSFIYDVLVSLWPTHSGEPAFSARRHSLMPGQSLTSVFSTSFEMLQSLFVTNGKAFGAEVIFRDASGRLWNRSVDGRLLQLKKFSWFRPWHVPHPLENVEKFPWYALRAKWRYRWLNHSRQAHLVPRWWAVDIRWARWRYARTHHAVELPMWRLIKRWKARHDIAKDRQRNGLPIPFWIVDDYWKFFVLVRSHARANRKQARQEKRDDLKALKKERSTWRRINPHE